MLGAAIPYTSPSGVVPLAAPAGFGATTGRIDVTLSANTTWNALTPGAVNGQLIAVVIVAGNFSLLLGGAGFSTPPGGVFITLNVAKFMYYDTGLGLWVVG